MNKQIALNRLCDILADRDLQCARREGAGLDGAQPSGAGQSGADLRGKGFVRRR